MDEAEWKNAEETKNQVLSENNKRLEVLKQEATLLAISLKKREIEENDYRMKLLAIRTEDEEIRRRNFKLVQEFIKVDLEYRKEHPEKFRVKTMEELEERLEKDGIKVDNWRLSG